MDIHIPDFRKVKYAYATIDTFPGFLVATALSGEATKKVISHCLHYFSMLGVPNHIKTDNGAGYYSQAFEMFCGQFNITHTTGISYTPQGQGISKL
jgi:transposase InsO family protein